MGAGIFYGSKERENEKYWEILWFVDYGYGYDPSGNIAEGFKPIKLICITLFLQATDN